MIEFLKQPAKAPLYTHSIDVDGASLSIINPAMVDSDCAEKSKAQPEPESGK